MASSWMPLLEAAPLASSLPETAGGCHMSTVRGLKGKKLCEAFVKLYQPDSSKDIKS